jgi:signal transduction histidine kinase
VAVRDITERRRTEQELERYRDHLEQLVAERTEALEHQTRRLEEALSKEQELTALQRQFVSTVSHEFRTPLAIIDGCAQRGLRKPERMTPERLAETLHTIRVSVKRLTDLMESVLSSSRLEAGTIAIELGACRLKELLLECCETQQLVKPDHVIDLDLDGLPEEVTADPKLIRQVLTNLLSNAVKYSPDHLRIWVEGERAGEHVVIRVRDRGVGIPASDLPKMFRRFYRARTAEGISGTGIGLNLVKHLIEMHGGSVGVDSIEGEGSTFEIRLPLGGPVREAPRSPDTEFLDSLLGTG